ncbi:hypothetical protein AN958_00845 [Leucoagaricus sp. SymC.cos]|nr:hypothetical protein AN958_00845 [Leucoagaricus sp. SymC.cos]
MSDDNELLSILEAHGQQFLQSFNLPASIRTTKHKATDSNDKQSPLKRVRLSGDESSSEEEWGGIKIQENAFSEEGSDSEIDLEDPECDQDDDGFTAGGSTFVDEKTVVFSENAFETETISKAQMKAFMSSKVSRLRDDGLKSLEQKKKKTPQEEEDERTNVENDALLHKLVHTKLLSGSLNPDIDMTPGHRRKALAGRVMELSGRAKLGKGERAIRDAEKNRAAKRVREGLARKQKERDKQELEEAKNLGNYHPTLKKLFEASGTSTSRSKSRGLGMGVGRFKGGVLQLSKQDIASVTGGSQRSNKKQGRKRN